MSLGSVKRGCGYRIAGGLYAEVQPSDYGLPAERFSLCPPVAFDAAELGLAHVGSALYQDSAGVWHVIDWVSSKDYPTPAHFVEEVCRHGLSRRLNSNLDLHLLTEQSRIILAHDRAILTDPRPWRAERAGYRPPDYTPGEWCPCSREHPDAGEMCAGLWWEDQVFPQVSPRTGRPDERAGLVTLGSGERFPAALPPLALLAAPSAAAHAPGLFMSLRLTNLAVVRAPDGGHERVLARAARAGLPVTVEDE